MLFNLHYFKEIVKYYNKNEVLFSYEINFLVNGSIITK